MRLLSVQLKNYRIHRDLRLEFDPHRTLIGGPNESGKSTLAEAIHRVLFLHARGNTALHRAMRSANAAGTPEVVLGFEVHGRQYTLTKRFGSAGSALLESAGSPPVRDDDVETHLAQILKTETDLSAKNLKTHWCHVWAWQGMATNDPSEISGGVAASLIQQLQTEGAGAILKSALDQKVADHFQKLLEASVGRNNRYLNGSAVSRALAERAKADTRLKEARARAERLQAALSDFHSATETLNRLAREEKTLLDDETLYHEKSNRLSSLNQKRVECESDLAHQKRALEGLQATHREIALRDDKIATLQRDMIPLQREIERLEAEAEHAKALTDRHLATSRELSLKTNQLNRQLQLANAHQKHSSACEEIARLEKIRKQIEVVQKRATEAEEKLHALPAITKPDLTSLRKIDSQWRISAATLDTMGVRLELLDGSVEVAAGTNRLLPNQPLILFESAELRVDGEVRIRVSPGTGLGITELRLEEKNLSNKRQGLLDKYGCRSIDDAQSALDQRERIEAEKAACEAELRGLDPDAVKNAWSHANAELREASATIEHLTADTDPIRLPEDRNAARRFILELQQRLRENERAMTEAEKLCLKAGQQQSAAQRSCDEQKVSLQNSDRTLQMLRTECAHLVQQAGDHDQRTRAIHEQQNACSLRQRQLDDTLQSIGELQPELMQQELARINRSRDQIKKNIIEASGRKFAAEALFSLDANCDPQEELASAEANFAFCEENARLQERKIHALQLISSLFDESQAELNARFTLPLQQRVLSYLRCLFGPKVETPFHFSDEGLGGIALFREGSGASTFDFETLSAGAREQTAAAFRFAIAEVLAKDMDGKLPVILDDAFANSDPERVKLVTRMLDLAASRGLQVILLSCTPEDYSGLGASSVQLQRPAPFHASTSDMPPTSGANAPSRRAAESAPDEEADSADCDEFVNFLRNMGGNAGNSTLRERLSWDEEKYRCVKDALVRAGRVELGRGRGGSVILSDPE